MEFHKTFLGVEPVGYNFLYSYGESFDFNFLSDLCTFDSSVFVGSLSTCLNCFVVKKDTHFSIYLCLPITTTPLHLSCSTITMFSFFDNSKTIFLCLKGTLTLEYFSQVCSTETYLKEELTHLEEVFIEKNNYPKYVIKQVFTQIEEEHKNRNYNNNMKNSIEVPIILENENKKRHLQFHTKVRKETI